VIKKLFDWTPSDIAYWERIRQKGLGRFILLYGLLISGGGLFLIFGLIFLLSWLRKAVGSPITSVTIIFVAGQLFFTALVCLAGGVVNSLLTWVVEERLYKKYKKLQSKL